MVIEWLSNSLYLGACELLRNYREINGYFPKCCLKPHMLQRSCQNGYYREVRHKYFNLTLDIMSLNLEWCGDHTNTFLLERPINYKQRHFFLVKWFLFNANCLSWHYTCHHVFCTIPKHPLSTRFMILNDTWFLDDHTSNDWFQQQNESLLKQVK